MSLSIGQIVGDYEVTGELGAGGMGSVYRVRNLISDRMDAMRVLLADLRSSADLADRFVNEIKVLASLDHPNIASLHTALRVDNQLLMVMEFVEGANLEERLRSGPIPVPEGLAFISQVLEALVYAHGRGVVHRDIKPANIAINSAGRVKLLDFGLARVQTDRRRTRAGMVLGSVFYMSPEQVKGEVGDSRSDLYSVGATLYRVVTGRRPIDGESEFAVMRAQTEHLPAPPSQWNPSLPRELSDAILRSLAKAPADRFQTAEEFLRALGRHAPPDVILPASVLDPAALAIVQKNLAQWLGPIAGTLIKRESRKAVGLAELCRVLSEQIPSEVDRRAFLKTCGKDLGWETVGEPATEATRTLASIGAAPEKVAWDPALLEQCRKELAGHVGPFAKVIVDRAAKKAHTREELYSLLSAEISSLKNR
jgi:eukaryotic-like serine/threonine-protein kinase